MHLILSKNKSTKIVFFFAAETNLSKVATSSIRSNCIETKYKKKEKHSISCVILLNKISEKTHLIADGKTLKLKLLAKQVYKRNYFNKNIAWNKNVEISKILK